MTAKKASKRTSRQKTAEGELPAQRYEPTPQERAALEALASRVEKRAPAPRMKMMSDDGSRQIDIDHEETMVGVHLLMNAVGTPIQIFSSVC